MSFLEMLPTVAKIIDKVIPDKQAAAEAQRKLLELHQAGEFKEIDADLEVIKQQVAINVAEAHNASLFVSGWRPAVGWVCAIGFGYSVLLMPLLAWAGANLGWEIPPEIDTGSIITLLVGMLGLGGMRTVEKLQGVARKK